MIGTVDTSEFAISISATLGFVLFLGFEQINWLWVSAFMIGGVLAAPLAAWLVRIIPPHYLGVLVGGFIILTNIRTLLQSVNFAYSWNVGVYLMAILLWFAAIFYQARKTRQQSRLEAAQ